MNKGKLLLILLVVFFISIRLFGIDLPYHQDEKKYALSVSVEDSNTPHPPISKAIMVQTAKIFGRDNFRMTPFLFSVANLLLLFYFVRFKFGIGAALWASALFTVSYYSILASLMVDIDGAILPFFFLLSIISYYKWQEQINEKKKYTWGSLLVAALIFGFLTKLSFIIVVGALVLDYLSQFARAENKKQLFKYGVLAVGLFSLLAAVLWGAKAVFPSFNLARTISHAQDYFHLTGRAYLQVLIQSIKAVLYLSPLLILPLIFITKERFAKTKFFWIFIVLGLIFYLIIFDFSRAALDKYLTFLIVPLSVITGVIFSEIFGQGERRGLRVGFWIGLAVAFSIFFLQFLPHVAPSLYPKEEWIGRIIKLKWNFVFPFTGGSGPVGFYISWLFIGLSWIISAFLVALAFIKKQWHLSLLTAAMMIGLSYNLVFAEEYIWGKINGSPQILIEKTVEFIKNNDHIKSVITYNDIGATELAKIGKFHYRIYAIPKNEKVHVGTLNKFKSYYLLINIPKMVENSLYTRYFDGCSVIYEEWSGKIPARVYDCRKARDATLSNQ